MAVLTVKDIYKSYQDNEVLKGIDYQWKKEK